MTSLRKEGKLLSFSFYASGLFAGPLSDEGEESGPYVAETFFVSISILNKRQLK